MDTKTKASVDAALNDGRMVSLIKKEGIVECIRHGPNTLAALTHIAPYSSAWTKHYGDAEQLRNEWAEHLVFYYGLESQQKQVVVELLDALDDTLERKLRDIRNENDIQQDANAMRNAGLEAQRRRMATSSKKPAHITLA